jgi:hypothetical protein
MSKRINIVLPEATIRILNRLAKPGQRSRFIDDAVRHYVATGKAETLRAQLEESALRERDLDRELMHDWLAVDREQWDSIDPSKQKRRTRAAAKSISPHSTRR